MQKEPKKVFLINSISQVANEDKINNFSFYSSKYQNNFSLLLINSNSLYKFQYNNDQSKIKSVNIMKSKDTSFLISCGNNVLYSQNSKNEITRYDVSPTFETFNLNVKFNLGGVIEKKKIKKISCGLSHVLFLTYGGMVYSSGNNDYSQLGVDSNDKNNQNLIISLLEYCIEDIQCGDNFNVIKGTKRGEDKENGDISYIFSWGENAYGNCGIKETKIINEPLEIICLPANIANIQKISVGRRHTAILYDNGSFSLFGDNSFNQCSLSNEYESDCEVVMTYNIFNDDVVNNIETSGYSTAITSEKGKVFLLGKVGSEIGQNYIQVKNNTSKKNIQVILNDENCLIYCENSKSKIEEVSKEIKEMRSPLFPDKPNKNEISKEVNEVQVYPNIDKTLEPVSFDDMLIDETQKSFATTDASNNSVNELKSYINLLELSLSTSYEGKQMTFRPSNLPPKSKEEEEEHRRLVQENRLKYRQLIKQKQQMEKEHLKEIELKQENEEKRANYWLKEIIPNWTIMKSNKNFEHYFYEGIPSSIRGQIWLLSVGNKFSITRDYYNIEVKKSIQLLMKENANNEESNENFNQISSNEDFYGQFIHKTTSKEKSIHLIELDIERTFSYLGVFKKNSPLSEDLREILRAFVVSRPDIGYVQGLSYVAGSLLLQMDKFQSFVCLMNITLNPNILPFYRLEEKGIRQRIEIFNDIFMCNLPALFERFSSLEILSEHFLLDWLMTLYTRNLHLDLAVRIWDVYMIEGIKSLYKAGIVILTHYEKKFMKMDFEDILSQFKNLQDIKIDQDTFVDSMRNVKFTDKIMIKISRLDEDYIPFN